MKKFPISAMVVGFNEADFLRNCLASLYFCDEIIYIDLNSIDSSLVVAKEFTTQIYTRPIVPSGEYIHAEMVNYTKHDWVIFIDPDEIVDSTLAEEISKNLNLISNSETIGAVFVPWHFYFKLYKLKGTIWGGNNKKYFLVNKKRFEFLPITHYGRKINKGFETFTIELNKSKTNVLHHYWMKSFKVFIKKHLRYLQKEGRDNYNLGARVSLKQFVLTPFSEFSNSYFKLKGYKDGFIGFFLSIFWAYYKTYIAMDIIKIQKTKLSFYESKELKKNSISSL